MTLKCRGNFVVRHGSTRLARLLARLLRFPVESQAVETTLHVVQNSQGERWERRFGDCLLVSTQRHLLQNVLVERFQFIEFRYGIEREPGRLIHRQLQTRICLGRISFRLPLWLAPRVRASETQVQGPHRIRVQVEVSAPMLGMILSYDGVVDVVGEDQ